MTRNEIFQMACHLSDVNIEGLPKSFDELQEYTDIVINQFMELEDPMPVPFGWMHEDELPEDYPYDEMQQYSQIRWGTRLFPIFNLPKPEIIE